MMTLLETPDSSSTAIAAVFLIVGALLLIFTLHRSMGKSRRQLEEAKNRNMTEGEYWRAMDAAVDRLSVSVSDIDAKIDERVASLSRLTDEANNKTVRLTELIERMEATERELAAKAGNAEHAQGKVVDFKSASAALVKRNHRRVYEAFDSGKNIQDISRETGLQLGEIELILALRDKIEGKSGTA